MTGMDVLRERIARALWENRYPGVEQAGPLWSLAAATAWARRFGVDVRFVEVGR